MRKSVVCLVRILVMGIMGIQFPYQAKAQNSELSGTKPTHFEISKAKEQKVKLIHEVSLRGNLLRLGDIFFPVAQAKTPIAQAPPLGETHILDSAWLAETAQKYGIDWQPSSRFEQVIVRRSSHKIRRSELESILRIAMEKQDIQSEDQVFIDRAPLEIELAGDSEPHIELDQLNINSSRTRFTAIFILKSGETSRTAKMSGRIVDTQSVPVLLRTLGTRDIINENDIEWIKLRSSLANNRVVTEAEDLIGMSPRRRLRAGTPIRFGDLRPPILITKGSLVNMVYQSANMELSATGKALEDASDGQIMRVLNTHSRRVVHARADSPDRVSVLPRKVSQPNLRDK